MSVDQSQRLVFIHPIERVNDIVSLEHREQTFNGSCRVVRPRLNVFPKDTPRVADRAQERLTR